MIELWNKEAEKKFFTESVKFATPEQLFYVAGYYLGECIFRPQNETD